MPKEREPGWLYFKSEILNEEFAIHIETGWVYFEKKAEYSPNELEIIRKSGGKLCPAIHRIKTIFKGEIVGYENKKEISPVVKSGELEIF